MLKNTKKSKIIIVSALRCEAEIFIENYKLKRITEISEFEIYRDNNQKLFLCISGVGNIKISSAIGFLFGNKIADKYSFIFNIGIAGGDINSNIGDIFAINKISYLSKKTNLYPAKIISKNIKRVPIITCDNPVTKYPNDVLVDMEAYGFMHTSMLFIPLEQIMLIKILSDNSKCSIEKISSDYVKSIMKKNSKIIFEIIQEAVSFIEEEENIRIYPIEYGNLCNVINFTFSQKVKLKKILIFLVNNNVDIDINKLISLGQSNKILEYLESQKEENVFSDIY